MLLINPVADVASAFIDCFALLPLTIRTFLGLSAGVSIGMSLIVQNSFLKNVGLKHIHILKTESQFL